MPPTPRKTAVKKAASKAPALNAAAKKAVAKKTAVNKPKSNAKVAAQTAAAKKATPAKKTVATQKGTNRTATVNTAELESSQKAADPKAVRGPDAETTITFDRVFPNGVPHDEWAEVCRRVARDALSSPVTTDLEVSKKGKGTLVKARFTRARGLPKTPR